MSQPALPPSRPSTPADKKGATDPLRDALEDVFEDTAPIFTDRPGFVRGDYDTGPLGDAVREITRYNCRRWASSDKSGTSARVNSYNEGVCGPYLEDIGERPPGGVLAPPFKGGQCCGVTYLFTYTFRNPNTGELQDSEQSATNVKIVGLFERSNQPAQPTKSGGPVFERCDTGEKQEIPLGTTFEGSDLDQSISNIRIADGSPDSCGNTNPDYRPPGTIVPVVPVPPDIIVDIPGIGPTTVIVRPGPEGDPIFVLPDINVEIPVTIGGGDDGGGAGGGDPGDPTDPGSPGSSGDTGSGGSESGEAGEGEELVGVLVQVLESPQGANTFDNNSRAPFRGIGYVRMGFPGRLGVDISGGTVISPQFFHAQQRGLTNWEVAANVGFNLRVTPYYRSITE